MHAAVRWLAALAAVLTAACAALPGAAPAPLLRLSPAAFGGSLAAQQHLLVDVRGQAHAIDALLEIDPQSVRLAMVSLGQTALRLDWDGHDLRQSQAAWWPAALDGQHVLSDLQLMLWPAPAIRGALPDGWTLAQDGSSRELCSPGGKAVARVVFPSASVVELQRLDAGYRIRAQSVVQERTP